MTAEMKHVEGRDTGRVSLYAISTCAWCKKTKRLLDELGVHYEYVDVDLLRSAEQDQVKDEVRRWNPKCSFPTMVVGDEGCIVGYDEDKIREALEP